MSELRPTFDDELEEVQDETQEQDTQNLSGDENLAETGVDDETAEGNPPSKKRRIRKEPTILTREPGKSLLPFSRVQKIIKADKENPMVARDAVFLISLATEEFIKRLSEASQQVAEREKRATVQHRDVATVVRKAEEFLFLDELIPWLAPDPPPKRQIGKPRDDEGSVSGAPTMLDQFLKTGKKKDGESEGNDIVMNEDGTMYVAEEDTQ